MTPSVLRFRSLCLALAATILFAAGAARRVFAQEIPSALPAIGRQLDIRDIKNLTTGRGDLLVTASHVYETATRFFDSEGNRRDLPLGQTVRRHAVPVFAIYGISDRLTAGAGASLYNDLERKLAVFNQVPGATLLGQPLAVGDVTSLTASGDGVGDLNLLLQYRPDWFDERVTSLVALEAVAPTAESDPGSRLDLPVGQGHWTYRLAYSALREIYPMSYFVRVAYEQNRAGDLRDAAGNPFRLDRGDGADWSAGASYAIGANVSLIGQLAGSFRDEGSSSAQAAPLASTRKLDFRPGYTFSRGALTFTQQLSIPIAGRNVLSTTGVLTTVEYRF